MFIDVLAKTYYVYVCVYIIYTFYSDEKRNTNRNTVSND